MLPVTSFHIEDQWTLTDLEKGTNRLLPHPYS